MITFLKIKIKIAGFVEKIVKVFFYSREREIGRRWRWRIDYVGLWVGFIERSSNIFSVGFHEEGDQEERRSVMGFVYIVHKKKKFRGFRQEDMYIFLLDFREDKFQRESILYFFYWIS